MQHAHQKVIFFMIVRGGSIQYTYHDDATAFQRNSHGQSEFHDCSGLPDDWYMEYYMISMDYLI